jgi:hypothetical protein
MNEGILTVEKQVMRFGPQAGLQSRLMDMVGSIRNQERERALQQRNVLLNRQNFEYGGLAGINRQQALSGGAPMDTELVAVTPQEKQMLQMFGPGYELDSGIKGYLPGFLKKIGKALKRAAPTILTVVGTVIGGPGLGGAIGAGFGRAIGGKIAGESTRDALLSGLSAGIGGFLSQGLDPIAKSAVTGFFAGAPGGIKSAVRGAGYGALAGGIAKGFQMRQGGGKFTDAFKYKDVEAMQAELGAPSAQEALVATGQPQGGPLPQDAGGATVDSLTGKQTFQVGGTTYNLEDFSRLTPDVQKNLLSDPTFQLENINVMDTLKGLSEPSLLQKAISPFNPMDPYGFEERLGLPFSPTKLLSAGALISEGTKVPETQLTEEQKAIMQGATPEMIAQYSFAPVATSPYYGMPVYQPLVAGYADGGVVELDMREGGESVGPGTGTSDDIPAMLSDGEFVMTAKAVRGAGHGSREDGSKFMYGLMSLFEDMA